MAKYIRYANSGATRNQPLSDDLLKRLSFLQDMGVTAEVFSGGQPARGLARVGSHRHDHGNAGDVTLFKGDQRLDWRNEADLPIFQDIVRRGKEAGITGFGAGPGYMTPGTMHIGMGSPAVWGKGGSGKNAPTWLVEAYNGAKAGGTQTNLMAQVQSGAVDPVAEVIAAKDKPSPLGDIKALASAEASAGASATTPTTEKLTLGDKIGKAVFGEELAKDLKSTFGPDAKPNSMQAGLGIFGNALNLGGAQRQQQQDTPIQSILPAVEAADAQRSAGAQQLMAAILNSRRKPRGMTLGG